MSTGIYPLFIFHYGYRKNPENEKEWIADEEAARVVRRIFDLRMEGRGPLQTAKQLKEELDELIKQETA